MWVPSPSALSLSLSLPLGDLGGVSWVSSVCEGQLEPGGAVVGKQLLTAVATGAASWPGPGWLSVVGQTSWCARGRAGVRGAV